MPRQFFMQLHVAVTDLETKSRIHFGPFGLFR